MLQSQWAFHKILKKFTNITVNLCKIYYNNQYKMYCYFRFSIQNPKNCNGFLEGGNYVF